MLSQRKEDVRVVLVMFKYLEDSSVKGEIGSRGQQKTYALEPRRCGFKISSTT